MLGVAAVGEVFPTGKDQPLFKEPPLETSSAWNIDSLPGGEKFLPVLYFKSFRATVETDDGPRLLADLPWAENAIVRLTVDELREPAVFHDLLNDRTNPIMLFGQGAYMENYLYPGTSPEAIEEYFKFVVTAREAFGDRFLALDYGEWSWGGVSGDKPARAFTEFFETFEGTEPPTDRDEAAAWWDKTFDIAFKRYQDAGVPVFSWNNSSLNHYEARKGSVFSGNEVAFVNPAIDSTLQAFSRGAGRQFGIPWGMYTAGFGGHFGHSNFLFKSPDERRRDHHGALRGAYTAVPIEEQRRTMYSVYMGGGNFLIKESDSTQGMLAGYDARTAGETHPRILALRDDVVYPGPYALLWEDFFKVVGKRDRGTPYTPIALLFDKNHGMAFKYSQVLGIGVLPYTTADEQMRGVLNTVFPAELPDGSLRGANYAAGPFGEIFDAITTEAPEDLIAAYPAIILVGDVRVDDRLAEILRRHVMEGGLLFLACEQMTPALWELAGIRPTGEMGRDSSFLRANDFYVYETNGFEFHKVALDGAEPLFVAGNIEQREWPVATINRIGDGAVITGTPVWMNEVGQPGRMHGVFSEIIHMIADELVPVKVRGSEVKVMYNRNETGWIVTLMNNRGTTIAFPGHEPAEREFDSAAVVLEPRFEYLAADEWISGERLAEGPGDAPVHLVIPPGRIRIVEFQTQ